MVMNKKKRRILKAFIKAINKYSKGKSPKKLKVYGITRAGKKIPIIERLEFCDR